MEGDSGSPNASVLGERSLLVGSSWVAAFLCFIILLTAAGNFLLILLIVTQRSLRNTSNYFLVSLFMSDLMVGLVVMPPAMLNQLYGRWVLHGDFCSLWSSFDVMCCSASILNLCIISLDRYLLIISPLKYKLRMTSCRALGLILATWTLAALASFLPIKMGWHKLDFEVHTPNVTSRGDEDQCRLLVSLPYALVASCLTFFLPSAAISFTYCRILLAARKQAVQVASFASNVATADETALQVRWPWGRCSLQNPMIWVPGVSLPAKGFGNQITGGEIFGQIHRGDGRTVLPGCPRCCPVSRPGGGLFLCCSRAQKQHEQKERNKLRHRRKCSAAQNKWEFRPLLGSHHPRGFEPLSDFPLGNRGHGGCETYGGEGL